MDCLCDSLASRFWIRNGIVLMCVGHLIRTDRDSGSFSWIAIDYYTDWDWIAIDYYTDWDWIAIDYYTNWDWIAIDYYTDWDWITIDCLPIFDCPTDLDDLDLLPYMERVGWR